MLRFMVRRKCSPEQRAMDWQARSSCPRAVGCPSIGRACLRVDYTSLSSCARILEHHKPTRTKCLDVKAGQQIVQRETLRAPHVQPSGCQWLVAFAVLGVDDSSSKVPLLLAYSPVARTRERRANQNPPKGGRTLARGPLARVATVPQVSFDH